MSTTTSPGSVPSSTNKASGNGWLGGIGQKSDAVELAKLPDAMTDPFAGVGKRLQATLDSYRFSTEPRSLIEWGVAQTGLNDPLSKFTRHELEQAFPRFARDRDNHLQELVRLIKKQGKVELFQQALTGSNNPAARNALQRAIRN